MSVLVPRGENWTIERGSMTIGDLIAAGKISLETVVLGEIPMTGDGCVIGQGAIVWPHPDYAIDDEAGATTGMSLRDNNTYDFIEPGEWEGDKCYSTKAAAEKARSKA